MPADVQLFELSTSPVFTATTLCRDFIPEFHSQARVHDPVLKRSVRLSPSTTTLPSAADSLCHVAPPASQKLAPSQTTTTTTALAIAPLRSILMVRSACLTTARSKLYKPAAAAHPSPETNKKRVVFADDRGLDLVQTKCISDSVCLSEHVVSPSPRPAPPRDLWQCLFEQPVSNYATFCLRLQRQRVCLESVVYQAESRRLVATVQVENICYEKRVSARVTYNEWRSHVDISATYMPPVGSSSASHCVYDRFRLEIPVAAGSTTTSRPLASSNIEFCLRFNTDADSVHWDNNEGCNYRVQLIPNAEKPSSATQQMKPRQLPSKQLQLIANDIYHLKFSTWSSLSSWSESGTPYW